MQVASLKLERPAVWGLLPTVDPLRAGGKPLTFDLRQRNNSWTHQANWSGGQNKSGEAPRRMHLGGGEQHSASAPPIKSGGQARVGGTVAAAAADDASGIVCWGRHVAHSTVWPSRGAPGRRRQIAGDGVRSPISQGFSAPELRGSNKLPVGLRERQPQQVAESQQHIPAM